MQQITLQPNDVLFFRDGRPMSGSLSGHGAAWPTPNVLASAIRSALHRTEIEGVHKHQIKERYNEPGNVRPYEYGSVVTAGPWPVSPEDTWYFPKPQDAKCSLEKGRFELSLTHSPYLDFIEDNCYSLPKGLSPVVSLLPPSKDSYPSWWSKDTFDSYLKGAFGEAYTPTENAAIDASVFMDSEHNYGIGINPETQAVYGSNKDEESQFYSASYLRLKSQSQTDDDWSMGMLAEAMDKVKDDPKNKRDLIDSLDEWLILGGQQRVCRMQKANFSGDALPKGPALQDTCYVKWVLLTPAIFPKINNQIGGWLPNWINTENMEVKLLDGPGKNKAKRLGLAEGNQIKAKLVAASVGKPVAITQWHQARLEICFSQKDTDLKDNSGPRETLLAVPAGSVYYFKAETDKEAQKLAHALNWHGKTANKICNRRSTLLGDKGFGLGVCGTWTPKNK